MLLGLVGLVVLFVGFAQSSVAGLLVMFGGLVVTVLAAAPPAAVDGAALKPGLVRRTRTVRQLD